VAAMAQSDRHPAGCHRCATSSAIETRGMPNRSAKSDRCRPQRSDR
jgi:hypothetical protein